MFQHTAARRRLAKTRAKAQAAAEVSTHSRPKAAGTAWGRAALAVAGFNTQPPEGGWNANRRREWQGKGFNTQPPEGGWH